MGNLEAVHQKKGGSSRRGNISAQPASRPVPIADVSRFLHHLWRVVHVYLSVVWQGFSSIPRNAPRTHNFLIPSRIPCPGALALAMEDKELSSNMPHYLAHHI
jgi:hypothetical protein